MNRQIEAIGLGCRRCGSSWLHGVLNQIPEIGKPLNGLHFFSEGYAKGIDWYHEHFLNFSASSLLLEFSVSYLYPEYCENVAKRIYEYNPNVKLFATLREPTSRAFSDYLRSVRILEIPKKITFENAVEEYPEFLRRGSYGQLLTPFYKMFGRKRIHLMFYDDLVADARSFLMNLLNFLACEGSITEEMLKRKGKTGKMLLSPTFSGVIFGLKDWLDQTSIRKNVFGEWESFKGKHLGIYKRILALNEKNTYMKLETSKKLREHYKSDVKRLEGLSGLNLEKWYD